MSMRILIPCLCVVMAACAPQVPNSARPQGVGFDSPGDYAARERARREAMLEGRSSHAGDPEVVGLEEITAVIPGAGETGTGEAAGESVAAVGNPQISDEQSFEAVTERETIESDAARIARQRAAYEQVAPTAVPDRPSGSGPNIVAFALETTNAPGQQVYRRSGANAQARFERACARYASADLAQIAFLEMGGPENDRRGMDPDGDGFACSWDPTPFRAARR